ncbi:hypothetical protein SPHINGO391_500105 [Sphingomonas aurantiaca]|uniref:Uncharacterized protein n=1 Tax=Sphingomonas aurantiaca TaxID=185949 RepID=A0A5E8AED4_9SPHN|nr:hypothetical protein SPHINGO391_500105 [Sphingomonas aurantiaca]
MKTDRLSTLEVNSSSWSVRLTSGEILAMGRSFLPINDPRCSRLLWDDKAKQSSTAIWSDFRSDTPTLPALPDHDIRTA